MVMRFLFSSLLLSGQILTLLVFVVGGPVWASNVASDEALPAGDAGRGRALFNGIGGCFNCHGYDAMLSRRPDHSPKLAEEVARLNPPPADLRNQASLKSQTEEDRLRSIKFGHPGTAMFPKKFLMERELADLLAYLATLRTESHRGNVIP